MDQNVSSRRMILAINACVLLSLVGPTVLAQTLTLNGGNISLAFSTPIAGSDFSDVVDNTSCSLSWSKPAGPGNTRISAQTNISSPTATLSVEAINVSGGQSTGSVTLSASAQNIVTGLSPGSGGCDLEYTASVTCSAGTGTDVHTVTFTITG